MSLITTGDFLRELEGAGLIQSADHILDRAAERGRNVERQRRAGADAATRPRLREQQSKRGRDNNLHREVSSDRIQCAWQIKRFPARKRYK